ncbi:MAG: hypothetical protein JJ868_17560 [Shimia sp.]|uniref:hypothetical protein n=1 Tax=Shimia sp. TaxID=1954381 RepID=UPI001B1E6D4A|nr:hypothetical protein [Shimia sp.]MBO6899179.1 hypothetical protein [Shimia sp.]
MTSSSEAFWRSALPDGETVLWHGQPDSGLVPQRFKGLNALVVVLVAGLWLAAPWILEEPSDFWKLFLATALVAAGFRMDQAVRNGRVYVVTDKKAWRLHRFLKSESLPIDPFLKFSATKRGVRFDSNPFFVFDHITDPDAAMTALKQAQEAQR